MNFDLEIICDANNLYTAFKQSKKNCSWKASVQSMEINWLRNLYHIQEKMLDENFAQKPFHHFILHDRGKTRPIKAVDVRDRIVLRSYCDNILVSRLNKYLIYDNGASTKNKGISFCRHRTETHLRKYFNEYGTDGYILQLDFSKFFDNIQHEKLFNYIKERMSDSNSLDFLKTIITSFKIDTGDELPQDWYDKVIDLIEYEKSKIKKLGKNYCYKSMGIGSQVSQISGLLFPTQIDNYCKIVKQLKYYNRYMDDVYIFHSDKEFLKKLLAEIQQIVNDIGLFLNPRKTQIIKFSRGFTFLKIQYKMTKTGKIIKRVDKKNITRERRKIKKFGIWIKNNSRKNFDYSDAKLSFDSWRGALKNCQVYRQIKRMEEVFKKECGQGKINELYITQFCPVAF